MWIRRVVADARSAESDQHGTDTPLANQIGASPQVTTGLFGKYEIKYQLSKCRAALENYWLFLQSETMHMWPDFFLNLDPQ